VNGDENNIAWKIDGIQTDARNKGKNKQKTTCNAQRINPTTVGNGLIQGMGQREGYRVRRLEGFKAEQSHADGTAVFELPKK